MGQLRIQILLLAPALSWAHIPGMALGPYHPTQVHCWVISQFLFRLT
jgi:hypothetical protein